MANVFVTADVKYKVVRKVGNKEVSQRFVKAIILGEMTEAEFAALHIFTDAVTDVTELIGD